MLLTRKMFLQFDANDALKILICCGCLGDRSDDTNEIVECDGCGVTVHEGKFFLPFSLPNSMLVNILNMVPRLQFSILTLTFTKVPC